MDAKFSVKFANIYMHVWLSKFITAYNGYKPNFIARLIDDCFFLWTHGKDELDKFITHLNGYHNSIKFEVTYSVDHVCFLDTITSIIDNVIHTTVYTKPTDKKQYLHFSSSHPKHTAKAIPYSQAIRYRRLIDNDSLLDAELTSLCELFHNRGYPADLLNATVDKIKLVTRDSVLQYKDKSVKKDSFDKFLRGKSFLPLILPFHQAFEFSLFENIAKHWSDFLKCSDTINTIFQNEMPQVVFKRGLTVGNLLTSTKCHSSIDYSDRDTIDVLRTLELENSCHNVKPCDRPLCKCCSHINLTSSFFNTARDRFFFIENSFNCSSKDVIYIISCLKCNKLYVGQTARMIRDRLNNHRSDIKLKRPTAISLHFNEPGHSVRDLKITPVADINGFCTSDRAKIEYEFMTLLDSIYPAGLNCYPIIK